MISTLIICVKVAAVLLITGWLFASCCSESTKKWLLRAPVWIMPGLFLIAMLIPNIWVLYISVFVIIPVLAQSRAEAAWLYPVVLLSTPLMSKDLRVGGAALMVVDTWRIVGFGLLAAVITKPKTKSYHYRIASIDWIMLSVLIFIIALPGIREANATSIIRYVLDVSLMLGIPFIALVLAIGTANDLRRTLIAFSFAAACQAGVAIYQSYQIWPIYEDFFPRFDMPRPGAMALKMRGNSMRATGIMLESTSFSLLMAMGLAGVIGLRGLFRSRYHYIGATAILGLGIFSTMARSGFVFIAVMIVGMTIYRRRLVISLGYIMVFSALYGAARIGAMYSVKLANLTGVTADAASTVQYRSDLLVRGWEIVVSHPFGVGSSKVNIELADLRQGEGIIDFVNGYLQAGIFGGFLCIILLVAVFLVPTTRLFLYYTKITDIGARDIAGILAGVFFATAVTCFTSGFGGQSVVIYCMFAAFAALLMGMAKNIKVFDQPSQNGRYRRIPT